MIFLNRDDKKKRAWMAAVQDFIHDEVMGSVALFAAAIFALVWANSMYGSTYDWLWTTDLSIKWEFIKIEKDLLGWVNSGLMTIFFFLVGLEIKRELVTGRLSEPGAAILPGVAALGGMVVPALIYAAFNWGGDGITGWAIPMATDIAFALGVLALLGNRVPAGLKAFLLTLAIVDDLGAILVIALFYSDGIQWIWLLGVAGATVVTILFKKWKVHRILPYIPIGIVAWYCMYKTGMHATLAGVLMGLLAPAVELNGRNFIEELEHILHPISAFFIMPVFALANAGVYLGGLSLGVIVSNTVSLGVILGLIVGKLLGVFFVTYIFVKLSLGILPEGVKMKHIGGVAFLAGIGFTVSLFIADLSFVRASPELIGSKIGILCGSLLSAILGVAYLLIVSRGETYEDELAEAERAEDEEKKREAEEKAKAEAEEKAKAEAEEKKREAEEKKEEEDNDDEEDDEKGGKEND